MSSQRRGLGEMSGKKMYSMVWMYNIRGMYEFASICCRYLSSEVDDNIDTDTNIRRPFVLHICGLIRCL